MNEKFTLDSLKKFIFSPSNSYFSGNTKYENKPERPGFYEIASKDGAFSYRDSYTGRIRSRGMEVVRYNNKPVWTSLYGGGMVKGYERMANQTFEFLKEAFQAKKPSAKSFRGPSSYKKGDWKYTYTQEGDLREFSGYEEILYEAPTGLTPAVSSPPAS